MAYAKSRLGKLHVKKADLLRDLEALICALEGSIYGSLTSGSYFEASPTGSIFPTVATWWESPARLKKLQEVTYVRNVNNQPTQVTTVLYTDGLARMTVIDTVTYSGITEVARNRVVS